MNTVDSTNGWAESYSGPAQRRHAPGRINNQRPLTALPSVHTQGTKGQWQGSNLSAQLSSALGVGWKKLTRKWLNEHSNTSFKETKLVLGVKGLQTVVIPEGTWLNKKGKHLQTTTASHFHLKLILGHTVQVIANVKLHKKEYYF